MSNRLRLILTALLAVVAVGLGATGYLSERPEAIINWSTESEVDTAGFHVYRATSEAGPYERVTTTLIPSSGDPFSGAEYEFRDANIESNRSYFYQLEELETTGTFTRLPDTVRFESPSGPLAMLSYFNWNVITVLIGLFALVWLLPGPHRPRAPEQVEGAEA